jgi:3',5'-cyclic AMP phosphodiesterase CpdA
MRRLVLILCVATVGLLASGAQAPATEPFFFLQFSDPQFGMFTADKDFAQETVNFEMAVETANRLRPAFVVVTGDLVNKPGDVAQIAEYRRIAARLDPKITLYDVAGNHDVENIPTPASVATYERTFGHDHYSFSYRTLAAIVLDSSLIHDPSGAPDLYQVQLDWMRGELARLGRSGAKHLVVFQHHPWFLTDAAEPDQYFNIPLERRAPHLALFHDAGVKYLFAGHYHRNALAEDGDIEMITTGPVGMPIGEGSQSGMRVVIVRDGGLTHRYYTLGELPNRIDLSVK